jgi:hypothetical protein
MLTHAQVHRKKELEGKKGRKKGGRERKRDRKTERKQRLSMLQALKCFNILIFVS